MKKTWKRLCTGFLALATVVTALPTIPVHAESKQYWTCLLYTSMFFLIVAAISVTQLIITRRKEVEN